MSICRTEVYLSRARIQANGSQAVMMAMAHLSRKEEKGKRNGRQREKEREREREREIK